jgi:hypothetical protein
MGCPYENLGINVSTYIQKRQCFWRWLEGRQLTSRETMHALAQLPLELNVFSFKG